MPEEKDDRSLLEWFRDTRSEPAFTELVRRHLPLVFQVAHRRLGSAALAEEAAQHAFARLAIKAAAVARHPERLRAWLHRTAYFEASTLARKETRLSRLPLQPEPEAMNRPEIYDRLDEALDKLPELDRELVLRHCCGGEDYRQMATAVGKSEAACQKRVERALARLAQGLSGTRTTAAVVAAFAVSSAKLPAAEQVAAAALKQQAMGGAVAGAISGTKVAACAALALAGGALGWQGERKPLPPPVVVSAPASISETSSPKTVAQPTGIALAPRPVRMERSLDQVLESILAGRLAPLVEFLPQATVADLRAIMAEDDIGDLSEGMGTFGTAYNLAARRWVELKPASAFEYGLDRSSSLATRMLVRWLEIDSKAAAAAFLAMPSVDRQTLARDILRQNDDVAGLLAAIDPSVAWAIEDEGHLYPNPVLKYEKAHRLVEALLKRKPEDEPKVGELEEIHMAFWQLAQKDRQQAIKHAGALPWPVLRAQMLTVVGQPPASETLPPGKIRTETVSRETGQLAATDPEAVIRHLQSTPPGPERDAIYEVISSGLSAKDPWRLLETVRSLEGSFNTYHLAPALSFAAKEDPQRALALLPDHSARFTHYRGIRGLADDVLSGWLEKDAPAAIRWAAEADIWLGTEELGKATCTPEALLELFSDENASVRTMARNALHQHLEAGLGDGTAQGLLDKIPREAADDMLKWIAADACGRGSYEEAMNIAALASAEAREQELLPQMALRALRDDSAAAVEWLKSLPPADRRAAVGGLQRLVGNPSYGGGDVPQIREALQQIAP
ncbi:sigma-70 family RNA polymerase sigma factor [Luteolibacter arcticus]|uniref:Sigma-70 family RNA polymerase sigma factor n=1 Tax=Luteolibacter arcticus TaxID=1581411 RepID=A0ABT3GBG7_9BACT|nr:sigma-70 family RNA polymerase sigma factor [Luteolibacter arcticus]MCW1920972.1 sigma-70 family RNA polymerase sigma factor [Luteolibacter arcticus]